jgi:TIR domain-containing protein
MSCDNGPLNPFPMLVAAVQPETSAAAFAPGAR